MRLKLNTSKTELIWLDRRAKRAAEMLHMNLDVDQNRTIHSARLHCVKDAGLFLGI